MVKSLTLAAAICCAFIMIGCGPGDGTLEGCSRPLYGTFDGDNTGFISAYLSFDGTMDVDYIEDDDTPDDPTDNRVREAILTVDSEGTLVTTSGGALDLTGTMDFDSCAVTGAWDLFAGDTTGNFVLEVYSGGL